MEDYREPITRVQKRHQFKRLCAIMGGMVFIFVVFVLGVVVGIHLEKERVRILKTESPHIGIKKGEVPDVDEELRKPSMPEKKDEKMRLTFHDTLTQKEAPVKEEKEVKEGKKEKPEVLPPKEPKEVSRAKVLENIYYVQVSSFQEKEKAEVLSNMLIKKGYSVHVIPVEIEGKGFWYRVRLGGYKSLKEAQEVKKKVATEEHIEGARIVLGP
jgi:cell division protein FtsN